MPWWGNAGFALALYVLAHMLAHMHAMQCIVLRHVTYRPASLLPVPRCRPVPTSDSSARAVGPVALGPIAGPSSARHAYACPCAVSRLPVTITHGGDLSPTSD